MTGADLIARLRRGADTLAARLPARHASVVQAVPLGPGARLIVVAFGGRLLLLGQSRAGLSLISEAAPE